MKGESPAKKLRDQAENQYFESKIEAQGEFRVALAKAISDADMVELYLLDFEVVDPANFTKDENTNYFSVKPYKTFTRILNTRELTQDERHRLLPELQKAVGVTKNATGAFCHFPIHGVRIFSEGSLLFESSFCWVCQNFSVDYLPYESGWVGSSGKTLQSIFEELMPIPDGELNRFEQFRKKGPKKKQVGKAVK